MDFFDFTIFSFFQKIQHVQSVRKYFGIVGVVVKEIVILNIVFGFVVLNSIWEHGLKQMFDRFFETFQKMLQKCEQLSYGTFGGDILGIFGPLTIS